MEFVIGVLVVLVLVVSGWVFGNAIKSRGPKEITERPKNSVNKTPVKYQKPAPWGQETAPWGQGVVKPISVFEYLRQYFVERHGLAEHDAAILILDPEFADAIEPLFIKAIDQRVVFWSPVWRNPKSEVVSEINTFCDSWRPCFNEKRKHDIQEYLAQIDYPMKSTRDSYRAMIGSTPIHIRIASFLLWGSGIALFLWLVL